MRGGGSQSLIISTVPIMTSHRHSKAVVFPVFQIVLCIPAWISQNRITSQGKLKHEAGEDNLTHPALRFMVIFGLNIHCCHCEGSWLHFHPRRAGTGEL